MQIEPRLHHAAKRNPAATARLRAAVRYLLEHGQLQPGSQTKLAAYYGISRQRVHQIVVEERRLLDRNGS